MVQVHVGKGTVLSYDLKDYFKSIKQRHLIDVFSTLGYADIACRTLAELCTYKAFVPQGALTSPKLSNIVTSQTFGPQLKEYCDSMGYSLSIYADDITISIRDDIIKNGNYGVINEVTEKISQIVSRFGFKVNRAKTKIMRPCQRQYVCGVVVNQKTNLMKPERLKLRAMVHNVEVNGVEAEAQKTGTTPDKFYSTLLGRVNWFSQLNPEVGGALKQRLMRVSRPVNSTSSTDEVCAKEANLIPTDSTHTDTPWD